MRTATVAWGTMQAIRGDGADVPIVAVAATCRFELEACKGSRVRY